MGNTILMGYKYRIYPNKNQRILIEKHLGCTRWIYNRYINENKKLHEEGKEFLTAYTFMKGLPELKEEYPWLKEVSAQSLQNAVLNAEKAYKNFFRKIKRKQKAGISFKNRRNHLSFANAQGTTYSIEDKRAYPTKFKEGIKCIFNNRQIFGNIKTCTVRKTKTNKYYIILTIDTMIEYPEKKDIKEETSVGIDVGIRKYLVDSDENKVKNPRFLESEMRRLKKMSKNFSRKKKGSSNWEKYRLRLAKLHEKITMKRNDFIHQITRKLINDSEVDTYCIETLDIQDMVKKHYIAQKVYDASWYNFFQKLKYKADLKGKNVIELEKGFPSSKICTKCGTINEKLKSGKIKWVCEKCGEVHQDRDITAAKNIKKYSLEQVKT